MTELEVDADLDVWVGLPDRWGEDTWPDHATWVPEPDVDVLPVVVDPERAIPPTDLDPMSRQLGLHRYEVVEPFTVYEGPIAPAFGQSGGGVQQFVDGRLLGSDLPPSTRVDVQWLLDNGYLAVRSRR